MDVKFILLLLIPICVVCVALIARRYIQDRFLRIFFTTPRIIVVTLIIMSMVGVSLSSYSDQTTTVAAVDISASMRGSERAVLEYLKSAGEKMSAEDRLGMVCFGEDAVVEQSPGETVPTQINSYVKDSFTNIAGGLLLSQTLIPEDSRKRILLISDGGENIGDAVEQAKLLKEKGVRLDVLPLKSVIGSEAQLSDIKTPSFIKKGMKYDVTVTGHALSDTPARLTIYRNNSLISNIDVTLRKGENKFAVSDVSDVSGGVIYRAEILPMEDTFAENNIVYGYSYIEGEPSVLVLDDDSSEEIIKMLNGSEISVTKLSATAAPASLENLNIYDAVIMPDIGADQLPEGFMDLLDAYVKIGGGLVVTGGENSYAMGGYYNTKLEEILPLDMDITDKDKKPDLGMIIVLDRSGSMTDGRYGVSKLELAKEAVVRSVDVLSDGDSVGVIAFDDGFQWSAPYQKLSGSKTGIKNNILNISPGGGTSILPGLTEAYETLRDSSVKQKHIILLTDGQAEQSGYDGIIQGMNQYGITLSTVAVGSGSDVRLLESLAQKGGGRYYYTDEFTDLPKIFTKETFLAGKDYLNNDKFFPKAYEFGPILSGIDAVPPLYGYVSTLAKSRADVLLISEKDEPVLAAWQYGLGQAVCFTSDLNGIWSQDWINSDEGVKIFRNMVSWSLRRQNGGDISISARAVGDTAEVRVSIPYAEGLENMTGNIISDDMTRHAVEFTAVAPGEYLGILDTGKAGAYIAELDIGRISGDETYVTGINIPYSDEFDLRRFTEGDAFLKRLADMGGGRFITDPELIFETIEDRVFTEKDISDLLLALALIIFIIDVAIRRFPVLGEKMRGAISKAAKIKISRPEREKKTIEKPKPIREKVVESPGESAVSTSSKLIISKKKRSGR